MLMMNVDYVSKLLAIAQNDENVEAVFVRISQMMLQKLDVLGTLQNRQLAKMCYVDASTISRFIKYLGFDHYAEFKAYFQDYQANRGLSYYFDFKAWQDRYELIESAKESLDATYQMLKEDTLNQVLTCIEKHTEILLCGDRYAQLVAEDFQLKLLSLGHYAKTYKDVTLQQEQLYKSSGLMILFSATVNLGKSTLKLASQYGWEIIIITRNKEASSLADICLLYDDTNLSTWTLHSVNDRFCMQAVIDQLVYLLAKKKLQNLQ